MFKIYKWNIPRWTNRFRIA